MSNSLNVGFGYTYDAGALIPDGSAKLSSSDPLLPYQPSTRPGHSLPDAWVEHLQGRIALGDLVGKGRFVLIAGEAGAAWCRAAEIIGEQRSIAVEAFTVGTTEGDWLDIGHAWDRLREHGPTGAVLVRPDRFIAWRAMDAAPDPVSVLQDVFAKLC